MGCPYTTINMFHLIDHLHHEGEGLVYAAEEWDGID
jgi:hypothetical protein